MSTNTLRDNDLQGRVVIAGASGFVGRALAPVLSPRFEVVGLSRSMTAVPEEFASVRACDLFSLKQAESALSGARWAIYLVHSMMPSARLSQGEFRDFDLICADNFARAAAQAGVEQIVYLGGLCPQAGQLSAHLESRKEIEAVLASHDVPVTTLRAGLILGEQGSSYQILVRLVRRLPVMLCPRWTNTRTQAVALADVVALVDFVLAHKDCYGQTYDIGAPDVVTYRSMMRMTAEFMGLRRFLIPTPVLSPGLSRLWVSLVTGAPRALVAPLVQSLHHEMVARDASLAVMAGRNTLPTRDALVQALTRTPAPAPASPHAFRGAQTRRPDRTVRSVQRMRLPQDWDAARAADEYMAWLPRFFRGLIRVDVDASQRCFFRLAWLGLTLLILSYAPERSTPDRRLFYVTGGLLTRDSDRARFELRQVFGTTLLTVVHDYEPRLPWPLYILTQAQFHLWVMRRFARHLASH